MKIKAGKYLILCTVVISLLAFLVTGCAGNENKPDLSKPPQIPPESSFVMDLEDFTSLNQSSVQYAQLASFVFEGALSHPDTADALGDRSYWGYAAFNVGFWNLVGVLGLAIPVASFIESFNHTPIQQDNYWVWTYDVPVGGDVYTAELHGKYVDNGVQWEMYISKQGGFTDFLWYYGESDLPATEGYWVLKNSPSVPSELIRIDWHRNLKDGTGDIKYTNIVPNGPENGGFISYTVTTGKTYNRFYEIYNKGKNQTTYIEWNNATREGRVRDSVHFGDNSWRCWDSQLVNAQCQ